MITLRAPSSRRRRAGIASARRPCSVRAHKACTAPATRNREVSDAPDRSRSSEIAQEWSAVAQSQASPFAEQMPCPCCVIFTAVQSNSGSAEIKPATTLVLPTLRECPPMTTMAINTAPGFRYPAAGHATESGSRTPVSLLFRQPRQRCQLLQILAQRLRWSSPEHHALAAQNLVGQNAALAAEHDSFFNARVL